MAASPSDAEFSHDEENKLLSEGSSLPERIASRRVLLPASIALLLVGAAACLVAGQAKRVGRRTPPSPVYGHKGAPVLTLTARGLLESPELAEVATDQLIQTGRGVYQPEQRAALRATVAEGFGKVAKAIRLRHPAEWKKLEALMISSEQKSALLQGMAQIGDKRVQRIGLEVAHAVRDCAANHPHATRKEMKMHILQRLQPRLQEIQEIRKNLPNPLLLTPDRTPQDDDWDRVLDEKNVRLLSTFGDDWDSRLESDRVERNFAAGRRLQVTSQALPAANLAAMTLQTLPPLPVAPILPKLKTTTLTPEQAEKTTFVEAEGYVVQAEHMMDEFKLMLKTFGQDLHLPPVVQEMIESSSDFLKLGACELGGMANNMNLLTMTSCPLKLGNEGLLAIKNVLVALDIPYEAIPLLGNELESIGNQRDAKGDVLPMKVTDDASNLYFHNK